MTRRFGFLTVLAGLTAGMLCTPPSAQAQAPTVGGYTLTREVRITRTTFEYTQPAVLTNPGAPLAGAKATAVSTSPSTSIVDGQLTFGPMPTGGSATSLDTFTIRHDRTVPFEPGAIQWTVMPVVGNRPPVSVIAPLSGPVFVASTVQLDGTGSSDPDADVITYQWSLTARPPGQRRDAQRDNAHRVLLRRPQGHVRGDARRVRAGERLPGPRGRSRPGAPGPSGHRGTRPNAIYRL